MTASFFGLDCLEHAGLLKDLQETPACLVTDGVSTDLGRTNYSCAFCGIGDSGQVVETKDNTKSSVPENPEGVIALRHCQLNVLKKISEEIIDGRYHPSCTYDILPILKGLRSEEPMIVDRLHQVAA